MDKQFAQYIDVVMKNKGISTKKFADDMPLEISKARRLRKGVLKHVSLSMAYKVCRYLEIDFHETMEVVIENEKSSKQ